MFSGITTAELGVGGALMVAASGLVVVFLMLAILALVIMVISKVVSSIEGKKPAAAPAPKKAAPAAAPAAPKQDEGELVSVMMAAVAEQTGMPMGSFQITNVAPVAAAPAAAPAPVAPATTAESNATADDLPF